MNVGDLVMLKDDEEDKLITIALAQTKGNQTAAAELLGISVRTIKRKIVKRKLKNK